MVHIDFRLLKLATQIVIVLLLSFPIPALSLDGEIWTSTFELNRSASSSEENIVTSPLDRNILISQLDSNALTPSPDGDIPAFSMEGIWILVYQSYGKGNANLVNSKHPVTLEFFFEANQLSARIWAGDNPLEVLSWPAFVNDYGPLPLEIVDRKIDQLNGIAFAHYLVKPSSADDLVLDIIEQYRITEQGNTLKGNMEVTFLRGKSNGGSFILHRLFERKP